VRCSVMCECVAGCPSRVSNLHTTVLHTHTQGRLQKVFDSILRQWRLATCMYMCARAYACIHIYMRMRVLIHTRLHYTTQPSSAVTRRLRSPSGCQTKIPPTAPCVRPTLLPSHAGRFLLQCVCYIHLFSVCIAACVMQCGTCACTFSLSFTHISIHTHIFTGTTAVCAARSTATSAVASATTYPAST
jgi:hypothetical protein